VCNISFWHKYGLTMQHKIDSHKHKKRKIYLIEFYRWEASFSSPDVHQIVQLSRLVNMVKPQQCGVLYNICLLVFPVSSVLHVGTDLDTADHSCYLVPINSSDFPKITRNTTESPLPKSSFYISTLLYSSSSYFMKVWGERDKTIVPGHIISVYCPRLCIYYQTLSFSTVLLPSTDDLC
jgi:hypothetical protein